MSYNLYPFREIKRYIFHWKQIGLLSSFLNLFGNIIGFAPLGFLLPSFSGRCRKYWYNTVMAGYLLSFGVELVQLLLRAGSCDIDDVILNTTGTLLGYCCFRLVQKEEEKAEKRTVVRTSQSGERHWRKKRDIPISERNWQEVLWELVSFPDWLSFFFYSVFPILFTDMERQVW